MYTIYRTFTNVPVTNFVATVNTWDEMESAAHQYEDGCGFAVVAYSVANGREYLEYASPVLGLVRDETSPDGWRDTRADGTFNESGE